MFQKEPNYGIRNVSALCAEVFALLFGPPQINLSLKYNILSILRRIASQYTEFQGIC